MITKAIQPGDSVVALCNVRRIDMHGNAGNYSRDPFYTEAHQGERGTVRHVFRDLLTGEVTGLTVEFRTGTGIRHHVIPTHFLDVAEPDEVEQLRSNYEALAEVVAVMLHAYEQNGRVHSADELVTFLKAHIDPAILQAVRDSRTTNEKERTAA